MKTSIKNIALFTFACLIAFGLTSAAFADTHPSCTLTGRQTVVINSSGPHKAEIVKKMCKVGERGGYKAVYSDQNSNFDIDKADVEFRVGYKDTNDDPEITTVRRGGPIGYNGAKKEQQGMAFYGFNDEDAFFVFKLLVVHQP